MCEPGLWPHVQFNFHSALYSHITNDMRILVSLTQLHC